MAIHYMYGTPHTAACIGLVGFPHRSPSARGPQAVLDRRTAFRRTLTSTVPEGRSKGSAALLAARFMYGNWVLTCSSQVAIKSAPCRQLGSAVAPTRRYRHDALEMVAQTGDDDA